MVPPMVAILVTGMSGTGTSTALAELVRRGFPVVDTDCGGFSVETWSAEESRLEQLWPSGARARPGRPRRGRAAAPRPADVEIDTRAPVAEVADRLVQIARDGG